MEMGMGMEMEMELEGRELLFRIFPFTLNKQEADPSSTNSLSPPFYSVGMRIAVWMENSIPHLLNIAMVLTHCIAILQLD
jgi:hypothetical protein